ncbi:MAG: hypothetical protein PF517_12040, partial [Salinivirgaceae bacterium]|nr:hypothetical protein [Salinivirgaceae bacterium]
MNITKFIKRIQSIIAEPQREFIRIAKEDKNPGSVLIEFTIPLIALYILTSYLGRIVFSPATFNVGTGVILKNIFMIVIVTILGIYLSAIAIIEKLPFYNSNKKKNKKMAMVKF